MRLAERIADLVCALALPERRSFAEAMRREVQAIDDPREAAAFAIGCLRAAATEGRFSMLATVVRLALASGMLMQAYVTFRPGYAILAHRQGWIGGATDHPIFLELAAATPDTLLAVWASECVLLLAAAVQLVRRSPSGVWLFSGAVAAFVVQHAMVRGIETYGRIFADWQLNLEFLVLAVLVGMGLAVHRLTRPAPRNATA